MYMCYMHATASSHHPRRRVNDDWIHTRVLGYVRRVQVGIGRQREARADMSDMSAAGVEVDARYVEICMHCEGSDGPGRLAQSDLCRGPSAAAVNPTVRSGQTCAHHPLCHGGKGFIPLDCCPICRLPPRLLASNDRLRHLEASTQQRTRLLSYASGTRRAGISVPLPFPPSPCLNQPLSEALPPPHARYTLSTASHRLQAFRLLHRIPLPPS